MLIKAESVCVDDLGRLEEGEEVQILASDYDKDPGDAKNLRATTMRLWKDKRLLSANDATSRKRRRDAAPEATAPAAPKKKKKQQPKRRTSPRKHK